MGYLCRAFGYAAISSRTIEWSLSMCEAMFATSLDRREIATVPLSRMRKSGTVAFEGSILSLFS